MGQCVNTGFVNRYPLGILLGRHTKRIRFFTSCLLDLKGFFSIIINPTKKSIPGFPVFIPSNEHSVMVWSALIEDSQSQAVPDGGLADASPGQVLQDPAVVHVLLRQNKRFPFRCRNLLRDIDKISFLQQTDRFHKTAPIYLCQKPKGTDAADVP